MAGAAVRDFDAVGMLELAYDLEATDADWLRTLVVAAQPGIDRGGGMFGMTYDGPAPVASVLIGETRFEEVRTEINANPTPAIVRAFTSATVVTTMRRMLAPFDPWEMHRWDRVAGSRGIRDVIGILAHDGEGGAINLGAISPRAERITRLDRQRWSRIAAHLGAALRMRRRREHLPSSVEAVLTRTGKVEHLADELRDDRASTASLRESTRNMTRARGAMRRDEDRALRLWPSMVSGRWTLVDHAGRDGARHVQALANIPRRPPLADLTPLERACVELARRGHANKQIAYALGLTAGTVGGALSHAMRKIGVRTRVGLIALGDAPAFEDVEHVLGATATRSEIAVAALAAAGLSNASIAEQRGVTARTIANQLARLFRRVGVGSRAELAVLLCQRKVSR